MAEPAASAPRDYRETLFLPETPFPMRAGLPQREPELIARWREIGLYAALRRDGAPRPKFVLHDGPPYANGAIHIGHAENKILKDMIVRSRQMMGYDSDYIPGWDCHGLPIEWKVEEEFRANGKKKQDVDPVEFRRACRAYADQWIPLQMEQFQRLGIEGDWANHYTTMAFDSEAVIAEEFLKVVATGLVYRGSKPVLWSPVERTSLAEAEVEYQEKTSPTIWVRFPVRENDVRVVIWTTTPWTIPGNRAISYNPAISYGIYEVESLEQGLAFEPWAKPGEKLALADRLAEEVMRAAKVATWSRLRDFDPAGVVCAHPFRDRGYGFAVPLLAGEHVTDDAGTGFVHTAPSHGADDFDVWVKHFGQEGIPFTVDADGRYTAEAPGFTGLEILTLEGKNQGKDGPANKAVIEALIEAGALLARGQLKHQYPHSWRSKAPLIFRNTPQWFIALDRPYRAGKTLREIALAEIERVDWGQKRTGDDRDQNRIKAMITDRPDWLISRQRAWGVPLAIFVRKATGEILQDAAVNERILAAMRREGADAWWTTPAAAFLGAAYDPAEFEKVEDILDVWFDSGCTHAFTLGRRPSAPWPAQVYLEGSDQHRGWFHSSLLQGCATRGRAPYDAVVTHGFAVDEQGRKMSKSLGNGVEPMDVAKSHGIEILRLAIAAADTRDELRLGKTILEQSAETYRKLRNTLRYLLGALAGFDEAERLPPGPEWPLLERWLLHRLAEVAEEVRAGYDTFEFRRALTAIVEFCNVDLSAFYVDVRKDSLYCDPAYYIRRRACRTALDLVFERLTAWLAPLAPFTTEEAWRTRFPESLSVHLRQMPATPPAWRDADAAAAMARLRLARSVVFGALEGERRAKRLGSSLEAAPIVHCAEPTLAQALRAHDFAELCIVSGLEVRDGEGPPEAFRLPEVSGVAVEPRAATGVKCARSWRYFDPNTADPRYPEITPRDAEAVLLWDHAHPLSG